MECLILCGVGYYNGCLILCAESGLAFNLKRVIFLFFKIKIFRRFNYFFQNKNKKIIVSAFFVFYFCLRNQQFFLFLPGKNMGTACESRTVAQL